MFRPRAALAETPKIDKKNWLPSDGPTFPIRPLPGSTAIAGALGEGDHGDLSGSAYLFDAGAPACPWDLDGDGQVNSADLTILLGAWAAGTAGGDIDGDGDTDSADLTRLLGASAADGRL